MPSSIARARPISSICRVDVADDDAAAGRSAGIEPRQRAARDIAGAAGDVEQALARTRIEPGDHLALPPAVDAGAHQVVHQVVAVGDAVEHRAHQRRLCRFRDAAEAEIGFACAGVAARAELPLVSSALIGHDNSRNSRSRTPRARSSMPELPEVETVRRGLALRMTGRRIVRAELRRPDLRRPFPPDLAERLDGARIGALTGAASTS